MKNKIWILAFTLVFAFSLNAFGQRNYFSLINQNASLHKLNGETVSLSDSKGKVIILAIGASWLPLSKQQIITTNKLVKKYTSQEVVIYWVTTESSNQKSKNFASNDQIQAFAAKNKLTATILRDEEGLFTLKRYSIDQLPSFVILDRTGKQAGSPFGGLDPENEPEIFIQVSGAVDKQL